MDLLKAAALENFKVTGNYRKDLLRTLYTDALDGRLFAEESVLLGAGAFEDCFPTNEESLDHYQEFVSHFEQATGKKFLGDKDAPPTGADYAPDKNLSDEEYRSDLMLTVIAAKTGCEEADDWELSWPGEEADRMRLSYAEILAYNAGINAWMDWLDEKMEIPDDEEYEAFLKEAAEFYTDEFLHMVRDLRKDLETAEA